MVAPGGAPLLSVLPQTNTGGTRGIRLLQQIDYFRELPATLRGMGREGKQ